MSPRLPLVLCAVAAACAAGGWTVFAQPKSVWSGVYSAEQADRGRRTYARECAQCHGANLMGGEGGSELVGVAFLAHWEKKSVGALFALIQKTMPDAAPGSLSERQYLDVLAYLLKENAFPTGKEDLPQGADALNAISFAKP